MARNRKDYIKSANLRIFYVFDKNFTRQSAIINNDTLSFLALCHKISDIYVQILF